MLPTNFENYKAFTEVNTLKTVVRNVLNTLKKNNTDVPVLINTINQVLQDKACDGLDGELLFISNVLYRPDIVAKNITPFGKNRINKEIRTLLTDFILHLECQWGKTSESFPFAERVF